MKTVREIHPDSWNRLACVEQAGLFARGFWLAHKNSFKVGRIKWLFCRDVEAFLVLKFRCRKSVTLRKAILQNAWNSTPKWGIASELQVGFQNHGAGDLPGKHWCQNLRQGEFLTKPVAIFSQSGRSLTPEAVQQAILDVEWTEAFE